MIQRGCPPCHGAKSRPRRSRARVSPIWHGEIKEAVPSGEGRGPVAKRHGEEGVDLQVRYCIRPCTFLKTSLHSRKVIAFPNSSRAPFLPGRIRSGGPFLLPTRVAYSSCVARYARSCSSLLGLHRSAQTILNRLCLSNPVGTAYFASPRTSSDARTVRRLRHDACPYKHIAHKEK